MRAFALLCVVVSGAACTPTLWSAGDLAEDCESPVRTRVHRTPEERADTDRPVIVTMRTREHDVTIYGGDGLRFTIAAANGTIVADSLDRQAFEADFPVLHEHFETAFAGESASPPVWAGM